MVSWSSLNKRPARVAWSYLPGLALAGMLLACGPQAEAADHLDAPSLSNPAVTGPVDINDIYMFTGTAPDTTVMIKTVNPGAGVLSPTIFDSGATYQFHVDNTGDAIADVIYQINFLDNRRSPQDQRVLVRRVDLSTPFGQRGIGVLIGVGRVGQPFNLRGGGRVQAGLFDDPFYFDLNGFNDPIIDSETEQVVGFNFTGDDFFAGLNVTAIVLEIPNAAIAGDGGGGDGGPAISLWCRTRSRSQPQIDRMGRPAINTVLIPMGMKNAFNVGQPKDDPAAFGATVINTLKTGPFFRSDQDAAGLTGVLLPDVLTFQVGNSSGFLNGRRVGDDVIDAELQLLTNNPAATDMVDNNDRAFPGGFPYLAPPHTGGDEG